MHWSQMNGVGPLRKHLEEHAESCGNDPVEAWQGVKERMVAAFTPENPELVVHAMYEAAIEYVKTYAPRTITVGNVTYEMKEE